MPSPFPGMNPYLESQMWGDFHSAAINHIREMLAPTIAPNYATLVERRVYLETEPGEPDKYRIADVALAAETFTAASRPETSATATLAPVECTVHVQSERRESYLEIRERESREVITVIELLSPSNKRSGGDGRSEYLTKRNQVFASATHLVEIDLLRGGLPLPTESGLPNGDYCVVVSRSYRRPKVDVYAWPLEHRMPTIPIPLRQGDGDAELDLQAVLDGVYDRAIYDLTIDYDLPVHPSLTEARKAWASELLSSRRQP